MNEELDNLPRHCQVNVVVLEGRHLALTGVNTVVTVSLGRKKKTIHAKTNRTDSPYYNEFCVFHYNLPLHVLLDEILIIKVYQKTYRKLVGSFSVELATVWSQPNHQFYHKWAVLTDPYHPTKGVRGFLKCDIAILTKGVVTKPIEYTSYKDEIEENLLVPFGGIKDRHRAKIIFSVFRADSFCPYPSNLYDPKLIQLFIRITYGGNSRKTNARMYDDSPIWNEELTFPDFIPPLYQNILVEVCDRSKPIKKNSLANTNIDIRQLYHDGEEGFLPTFGPSFIYLYRPFGKYQRHRDYCCFQNSFTYMCRLLFSIRTEIVNYAEEVKVEKRLIRKYPKPISPLVENNYFKYKKFILFAAIFDVLLFDAKVFEKNVSIRLTLGPRQNTRFTDFEEDNDEEDDEEKPEESEKTAKMEVFRNLKIVTTCNTTPMHKLTFEKDYAFIDFSGMYPCVYTFGEWPDTLRRIYRSNIIKKSIQNFIQEANKIKYEFEVNNENNLEFSKRLRNILADLSKSCEFILLMTSPTNLEDTNLYRERRRVYRREIAEIAKNARIASSNNTLKTKDDLDRLYAHLTMLTKYAQDPEMSFPDTEVWMLKNSKISAQHRIKTEDIAYSSDENERGSRSGKTQTIIFGGERGRAKAKLDLFAWFGLADDFVQCLEMLPSGYKLYGTSNLDNRIPNELTYEEVHYFQLRVHIFGAKIMVGFDNSGLVDAFIRVIIFGQNQVTQVQKATLSPVWDETLVFPHLKLYGTREYIKENSITVVVEVFDKEKYQKPELVGRCFVNPVVKLSDDKYEPPRFPPKLKWEDIQSEVKEVGKVLMVTELLEVTDSLSELYPFESEHQGIPLSIPKDIRPVETTFRLEIFFWGVRQIRKRSSIRNRVYVTLECGENILKSAIIHNVKRTLNFPICIQIMELELPADLEYAPPVTVKLYHKGRFKKTFVGTSIVPNIKYFYSYFILHTPPDPKPLKKDIKIQAPEKKEKKGKSWKEIARRKRPREIKQKLYSATGGAYTYLKCKVAKCAKLVRRKEHPPLTVQLEKFDKLTWWTRYNASVEGPTDYPDVPTFKVYPEELEAQPEFKNFMDYLYTFDIVTGHQKRKKKGNIPAKVKVAIKLYKWPPPELSELEGKKLFFKGALLCRGPTNEAIRYVVRVYVICGKNLAPRDMYGKSDPYLLIQLGDVIVSERKNYAAKQLNPTFGKCFELLGTFPQQNLLRVKVIDYDASSKDDLIGETTIDIENRYYSKHHATCGIPRDFKREDFESWKDIYFPTDILKRVCKMSYLDPPIYERDRVIIGRYKIPTNVDDDSSYREEAQALMVLHKWHEIPERGFHLVPEHIETRSLYHPSIPGVEQGKLEMWVDIFPADFRYMPPKIDITPKKPIPLELRAIVWNVDDVVLDDKTLIYGEKMSDIYVRAWILSLEEEMQKTDVHYRSLNGEGNFNWRFIFHFNYIPSERKMVVKKKMNAFDTHPEEIKHQCKLEIQIWDNDAFGDDYLGTLILELCSMPRGAKVSSRCTLKMLAQNAAKINLFNIRRTRGWWPFRRLKEKQTVGNEYELTGKIDLELEILTEAEALQYPAGKGREGPAALNPPKRPVTSFNWMLNPVKTVRFIIWKKVRKLLLWAILFVIVAFFFLVALYAFPNYLVKKILHA